MKKQIAKIDKLLVKYFGIPDRKSPLPDPVDILIGTILSQNTNDNNSYKAYLNLKENYPAWKDVAELPLSKLESVIKVAGLGKQKSKAIKHVLQSLQKKSKDISLDYLRDETPEKAIADLTSFTGVGTKTASCVLLFSFNQNICPVDTHVHRTLNRIGIVETKTPDKTFQLINGNIPDGAGHRFHTNLIKLGRSLCRPKIQYCFHCPLNKVCAYQSKNMSETATQDKDNILLLDSI